MIQSNRQAKRMPKPQCKDNKSAGQTVDRNLFTRNNALRKKKVITYFAMNSKISANNYD